jgi:hypothetical protein
MALERRSGSERAPPPICRREGDLSDRCRARIRKSVRPYRARESRADGALGDTEVETRTTHGSLSFMPDGQEARHDGDETTALANDAGRRRCTVSRRHMLPPPTWIVERMRAIGSVDGCLRGRPLPDCPRPAAALSRSGSG